MSETIIPKEQLTAYQRWELPAFDAAQKKVPLPTASQVEQIYNQARDEGYRAGMQQASNEAQRMAEMLSALDEALHQMDQAISQDLLNLALEIAKQMLHQALEVKPELLLNVINAAISELPHFNQNAHLVLHPADAELVRTRMGEQLSHAGWKIFEDSKLARGGCRVETAHSQIDATLATRLKRVAASIGQDNSWLEP